MPGSAPSSKLKPPSHRCEPQSHRRRFSWCCSFAVPSQSPDHHHHLRHSLVSTPQSRSRSLSKHFHYHPPSQKTELPFKSIHSSFPNSPQSQASATSSSSKLGLRRILSPGRVSPIDDSVAPPPPGTSLTSTEVQKLPLSDDVDSANNVDVSEEPNTGIFDVRLSLKGKNGGGSLVLELCSEVLASNSTVFADLITDYRRNSKDLCRIEVPEVENLNVFRETIEMMFDEDVTSRLLKIGVYRAIDILEVAAGINFSQGVFSCLKYLEAVPWTEEEEEKLRILFSRYKFDETLSGDIIARLHTHDSVDSEQVLTRQLLWSITTCVNANAGNELKSLVKGLLSTSSVYEKDHKDINKDDVLAVCQSCLSSLRNLFEEASSGSSACGKLVKSDKDKPLIERISKQADNISWLLEILIDHQVAEEMVDIWVDQKELLVMHRNASPMIRYELSRVSAMLFIAIGTRRLHCRSEARLGLLQAWFRPMLMDFGWLQRCRKGLDMKALEEAMGQALLTLPLREQYALFMEWFRCFSKHGTECPNLSKAFQIWWRRSFLRGSETYAIESR